MVSVKNRDVEGEDESIKHKKDFHYAYKYIGTCTYKLTIDDGNHMPTQTFQHSIQQPKDRTLNLNSLAGLHHRFVPICMKRYKIYCHI